jgi:hypothetical protein
LLISESFTSASIPRSWGRNRWSVEYWEGERTREGTYLEEVPGILGRSDIGLAVQCNPGHHSSQSIHRYGHQRDLLDECVSVEILDETRNTSDTALGTAREGSSDGTSLALSVLLQYLETCAEEIEEGDDERSEGD